MLGKTSLQDVGGRQSQEKSEHLKGKDADSSSGAPRNGFVRPVAVASIFRPNVEDAAAKKPLIPEKRRFSAFLGDFTPCNDPKPVITNEEFARRRQSWNTRTVPEQNSLPKKIPRSKNVLDSTIPDKEKLLQAIPDGEPVLNGHVSTDTQENYLEKFVDTDSSSEKKAGVTKTGISDAVPNPSVHLRKRQSPVLPNGDITDSTSLPSSVSGTRAVRTRESCASVRKRSTERIESSILSTEINKSSSTETQHLNNINVSASVFGFDSKRLDPASKKSCVVLNLQHTESTNTLTSSFNSKVIAKSKIQAERIESLQNGIEPSKADIKYNRCYSPVAQSERKSVSVNSSIAKTTSVRTSSQRELIENSATEPNVNLVSVQKTIVASPKVVNENIQRNLNMRDVNNLSSQIVPDSKCSNLAPAANSDSSHVINTQPERTTVVSKEKNIDDVKDGKNELNGDVTKTYNNNNLDQAGITSVPAPVKLRSKESAIPANQIEDLPKNVRLVRRTSDLIANKISSIFSKVNAEKELPLSPSKLKSGASSEKSLVNKNLSSKESPKPLLTSGKSAEATAEVKVPAVQNGEVLRKDSTKATEKIDISQTLNDVKPPQPNEDNSSKSKTPKALPKSDVIAKISSNKSTGETLDKIDKNVPLTRNTLPKTEVLKTTNDDSTIIGKAPGNKVIVRTEKTEQHSNILLNTELAPPTMNSVEPKPSTSGNTQSSQCNSMSNGLCFLKGVGEQKMTAAIIRNNSIKLEKPDQPLMESQNPKTTNNNVVFKKQIAREKAVKTDAPSSSVVELPSSTVVDTSAGFVRSKTQISNSTVLPVRSVSMIIPSKSPISPRPSENQFRCSPSLVDSNVNANGLDTISFYLRQDDVTDRCRRDSSISVASSSSSDVNSVLSNSESRSSLKDFRSSAPPVTPPRPPDRKRTNIFRDSSVPPPIPPHCANISRTASLKRFEDSKLPSFGILRSPSHSCVPTYPSTHRYSYTEMLSKVCSYGITPSGSTSSLPNKYNRFNSGSLSQVSELWSDLTQEQTSSAHSSEILEAETSERMRLEKEIQDLQSRYSHAQQKSDKMEMEMMEARVYRSEINGALSEDEDAEGNSSIYKQKYERAVRDMEMMKRRIQQQHEEIMEQNLLNKKAADKKLAEAFEDVEEERQVAGQWKRKTQKLNSELQDLRLMLEEQMARNGELEKKQRRFDAELSTCQEEIKKEKVIKEKAVRERDQSHQEKYSLEQELHSTRLDMDMQHEKITQLNRELEELSLSSKGEEEVTQLKRSKQELERKSRDQEEELEELAGQVQMLEQAKLRLEMSLEKLRQEHRRENSVREEEIEEIRASFSKKVKNLEAQLETEQEDRHQMVKQKHELERRVIELTDQPPQQDPEIERRLRRDLKRTKALLRDAQSMLEHVRDGQGNKTIIRQLKNQLEDVEFSKCAAIKAKQTAEMELQDSQLQLEEVTRVKNESEGKCLQLSREKSTIQTQLEEMEEELTEVMKKFKASVAQLSIEQKTIAEQNQQITELEMERHALKEQLSEVSTKFEHLAGQSEDTGRVYKLDARVRDLESKLDLEQTTRGRLEHQITRLKEQIDRMQEECDNLRNKELQAQEGIRRFQRQIRDLREDYTALQQKEAEAYRKQHDLELALENAESDLKVTKNDLRLAVQRIEELKNALEDDLDSGTDVPDDSGSDSDSSLDISMLRHSMTPIQRCDSASSDLSFSSRRSITPSLGQDYSAMCRLMWSQRSMDFLT